MEDCLEKESLSQGQVERYVYIDFLRVAAILLMFIYHVNMVFVAEWDWHIKNNTQSNVLMEVNYWMAFFRMPLLFFVSGFISCILLEKLSIKASIIQRFNRLIIPTAIWTFVLVAPQIYFERKLQGNDFTYLEFYKTFLQFNWWPNGNFHWLHLWFIPYLFLYNVISIPVFRFLQRFRGTAAHEAASLSTLLLIALFVVVAIIPYTILSVHYPVTYDLIHDYARHSQFIFFVFAGLLSYNYKQIMLTIEINRALIFRLAFASIITINIIRWNGMEPKNIWDNWLSHPLSWLYLALLNANSWLWVLAIIGYGKRYIKTGGKLLTYSNSAVYPFYILHQTVIVVVGYYVVQTRDDAAFKYAFLLIACFLISVSIYHWYIRPFKVLRFTFGAK